ncbi:hypothetical protein STEG23_024486, partial [Scotinomys teguina]
SNLVAGLEALYGTHETHALMAFPNLPFLPFQVGEYPGDTAPSLVPPPSRDVQNGETEEKDTVHCITVCYGAISYHSPLPILDPESQCKYEAL